jgi:anti-sigma factor RsiW
MNRTLQNHRFPDASDERLIDRLVDGELPELERRELLRRLDSEPNGWRRCALAFLEAQNWRAALAPLDAPAAAQPAPLPPEPRRRPRSWRSVRRLTGLAAALAMAFALGWTLRGGPYVSDPHTTASHDTVPVPATSPNIPQAAPGDLVLPDAQPSWTAALDPVVKHWERRGYHADAQMRMLSVELKDGRRLNLPVHEVRLRYVGNRIY